MQVYDNDYDSPSYENYDRVLLIGEADYSFARAFAQASSSSSGKNFNMNVIVTATEYGDGDDIATRYYAGNLSKMKGSMSSLFQLDAIGDVVCGLNARDLGKQPSLMCKCQRWNERDRDWDSPTTFWQDQVEEDGDEHKRADEDFTATATNGGGIVSHSKNIQTFFNLIIFNFPHSEQAGRASKLVRALFKQLRLCIDGGRLPADLVLEMRLRVIESNPHLKKNIRSFYNHEEAAGESGFELLGYWPSDLERWEKLGYMHMWTKRNATCRDIGLNCNVWRWTSAKKGTKEG